MSKSGAENIERDITIKKASILTRIIDKKFTKTKTRFWTLSQNTQYHSNLSFDSYNI